jgi:hypothetical protein
MLLVRPLAALGDLLAGIGLRCFPLTSRKLKNITTEYIYNLDLIKAIAPSLPYSLETAARETVMWVKYMQNNAK